VVGDQLPYLTYVIAVIFTAWLAGLGPALLATAIGSLAATYLFVPLPHTFAFFDARVFTGFIAYWVIGLVSSLLIEAMHRARRRADMHAGAERESREALKQTAEQLTLALEAARMGTWEWNIQTGDISWSDSLAPLHGVAPGAFKGTYESFLELIHPDDRELLTGAIARSVEQGLDYDIEFRVVWPDRSVHWMAGKGKVFRDEQNRPARMMGLGIDITERKRAEEASAFFTSIIESSDDAIIGKSLDGIILTWNLGAEKIYGYKAEEVIGKPISILAPLGLEDEIPAILDKVRRGERISQHETVRARKDGQRIDVSLTISPVWGAGGKIIGASTIARDVTERNRLLVREQSARAQAEAANRLKDEFLATVSHELRTPLNAILGWATMLNTGRLDEQTAKRAIVVIDRNARAQTQLIEDILDVSRIISGKIRLDIKQTNIISVINAAIDSLRPAADAKGISVELKSDAEIGPVPADPGRLQQVVWNLLSNAIKFTPDEGRVEIKVERDTGPSGQHAQVVISDTGIGITPDFLPHVFERFLQGDGTITRRHGGLGLGLAIVRHIVEMHGGTIKAESEGTGKGANFVVRLPLRAGRDSAVKQPYDRASSADDREEALPSKRRLKLEGLRILVVDDEPDTCELLKALLEYEGAQVISTTSVASAIEAFKQGSPDLLVSDIAMPEQDGYTLINSIRALDQQEGKHTPALALTAHAGSDYRAQAKMAGYEAFVSKPVGADELLEAIEALRAAGEAFTTENGSNDA
jgi:PAS domain S-box-containing protein